MYPNISNSCFGFATLSPNTAQTKVVIPLLAFIIQLSSLYKTKVLPVRKCIQESFDFPDVKRRTVEVDFQGVAATDIIKKLESFYRKIVSQKTLTPAPVQLTTEKFIYRCRPN